jgi:AcrR family transcriptional regulator
MTQARMAELLFDDAETIGTRERLLISAVQAFSSMGYDGVSVREIERASGVNRGLISYHFGSKEELWQACVDLLMEKFHGEMVRYRPVLSVISPAERAKVILKIYVGFASKYPELWRLLMVHGNDPGRMAEVAKELRKSIEFFGEVTGTAGVASPEDSAMACFLFLGAASSIFAVPALCELMYGVDPRDADFIDKYTEVVASFGFFDPGPLGGKPS